MPSVRGPGDRLADGRIDPVVAREGLVVVERQREQLQNGYSGRVGGCRS